MKQKRIRYIGDTMDEEIKLPKWPKFNIYADTETYLDIPNGEKPWEYFGTPKYNDIMHECNNVPWLLVWTFRNIKRRANVKQYYIAGGWCKRKSIIWEKCHMELFADLHHIYKTKRLPVLYFHNASFDIPVMMAVWRILDPNVILYTYSKNTNKNFLRGVLHSPKFGFKCLLGDTMLFEMISIAAIGESLGLPKGKDVPYTMCNLDLKLDQLHYIDLIDGEKKTFPVDLYIEYAERDVEIQREYYEMLGEKKKLITETVIERDEKSKPIIGTTQGTFAKELVNLHLWHNGFKGGIDTHFRFNIPEEQEELYQQTVKSNMGGYTTFNKDIRKYKCTDKDQISVYDCNSMYPYILTGEIPFGDILDYEPIDSNSVTWYVVSFKSCKWNKTMESLAFPPISQEKTCGVVFYMLKEYYEMLQRLCIVDSEIHAVKYQRTTKIFKPFIDRLYNLRKEHKAAMKILDKSNPKYEVYNKQQHGCKIIMNSIYGKLCEKSHREACFYYSKTCQYKKYVNKDSPFKCILSGSFITYKGRLLLIDKLEQCIRAGYRILYADTDSVMFAADKEDKQVSEIFGIDSGELGQWKCEGIFNIFFNPGVKKKYVMLDFHKPNNYKIAWSGINKAVPEAFRNRLDKGDRQAIKDLEFIFSSNQNVVFRKQKRTSILSNEFNQKIIYDVDFQMNPRIKEHTGECIIHNGDYILIRYVKK